MITEALSNAANDTSCDIDATKIDLNRSFAEYFDDDQASASNKKDFKSRAKEHLNSAIADTVQKSKSKESFAQTFPAYISWVEGVIGTIKDLLQAQ